MTPDSIRDHPQGPFDNYGADLSG